MKYLMHLVLSVLFLTSAGPVWGDGEYISLPAENVKLNTPAPTKPLVSINISDVEWKVRDSEGRVHLFEPVVVEEWYIIYEPGDSLECRPLPGHLIMRNSKECRFHELQWLHKGIEGGEE